MRITDLYQLYIGLLHFDVYSTCPPATEHRKWIKMLHYIDYTVDYATTIFKIISNFPSLFEKYHGKSIQYLPPGN